jgi:hypothetical protein
LATSWTSFEKVAENNNVCLGPWRYDTILSTSRLKPISNNRSASSNINTYMMIIDDGEDDVNEGVVWKG